VLLKFNEPMDTELRN